MVKWAPCAPSASLSLTCWLLGEAFPLHAASAPRRACPQPGPVSALSAGTKSVLKSHPGAW